MPTDFHAMPSIWIYEKQSHLENVILICWNILDSFGNC